MEADFMLLGRDCSGVFGLCGSSRGLVVLGTCSTGVLHPLSVGVAIWATENPRGSSPGHLELGGPPQNGGQFFMAGLSLF